MNYYYILQRCKNHPKLVKLKSASFVGYKPFSSQNGKFQRKENVWLISQGFCEVLDAINSFSDNVNLSEIYRAVAKYIRASAE